VLREVQARGLCGACGGCVSFCSAGELNALVFGPDGLPRFADEDRCLKCGICYLICPQIQILDGELRQRFAWKPPLGAVRKLLSARTTSRKVQRVCTDGGAVTSLLLHALAKGLIQGAIVAQPRGPFSRQAVLATRAEEIIAAAGSHYDGFEPLSEVGRRYATFVPTVREIKGVRAQDLRRIALVGTPCQIHTLRKMQLLSVVPADAVTLTIGLFCMQSFSFEARAWRGVEKVVGVGLKDIRKVNVKDDVIVTTRDGRKVLVPFYLVDEFARPACFACTDFANEFADISCGGLGSPDGYTTVLVRTAAGERLYNSARQARAIQELGFNTTERRRNHVTEMMAKIVSFTARKRARAAKRLEARHG
jgi:coenzyme F420 hydrogenase subunit beta